MALVRVHWAGQVALAHVHWVRDCVGSWGFEGCIGWDIDLVFDAGAVRNIHLDVRSDGDGDAAVHNEDPVYEDCDSLYIHRLNMVDSFHSLFHVLYVFHL